MFELWSCYVAATNFKLYCLAGAPLIYCCITILPFGNSRFQPSPVFIFYKVDSSPGNLTETHECFTSKCLQYYCETAPFRCFSETEIPPPYMNTSALGIHKVIKNTVILTRLLNDSFQHQDYRVGKESVQWWVTDWTSWVRFPARNYGPDRLWSPRSLISSGCRGIAAGARNWPLISI